MGAINTNKNKYVILSAKLKIHRKRHKTEFVMENEQENPSQIVILFKNIMFNINCNKV